MDVTASRLEFGPPPSARSLRALGLAVLAHALLLAALTWGVHWKNEPTAMTAEAELWSAVPQQAAPRLVEAPPPQAQPAPPPLPPARVVAPERPKQAAPEVPNANIVLEREKRRAAQEKQDKEILAQQKLAQDKQVQAQKTAKLDKLAADKKRLEEKLTQDKKAVEEKKQAELAAKKKDALKTLDDEKKLEAQRQENIKRMAGLAGASGSADAPGTALKSSGLSSGYGARIQALIKPKIVFTDDISSNPTARVEVRTAPDGTIISRKILKSSGVPSWDEAVLKAIDKTESLPRDVDGRVPTPLDIGFRLKD